MNNIIHSTNPSYVVAKAIQGTCHDIIMNSADRDQRELNLKYYLQLCTEKSFGSFGCLYIMKEMTLIILLIYRDTIKGFKSMFFHLLEEDLISLRNLLVRNDATVFVTPRIPSLSKNKDDDSDDDDNDMEMSKYEDCTINLDVARKEIFSTTFDETIQLCRLHEALSYIRRNNDDDFRNDTTALKKIEQIDNKCFRDFLVSLLYPPHHTSVKSPSKVQNMDIPVEFTLSYFHERLEQLIQNWYITIFMPSSSSSMTTTISNYTPFKSKIINMSPLKTVDKDEDKTEPILHNNDSEEEDDDDTETELSTPERKLPALSDVPNTFKRRRIYSSNRKLKHRRIIEKDEEEKVRKVFTDEEKAAIKLGVEKFGKGRWANIRETYFDVLGNRTNVQIKDCYRNMVKKGDVVEANLEDGKATLLQTNQESCHNTSDDDDGDDESDMAQNKITNSKIPKPAKVHVPISSKSPKSHQSSNTNNKKASLHQRVNDKELSDSVSNEDINATSTFTEDKKDNLENKSLTAQDATLDDGKRRLRARKKVQYKEPTDYIPGSERRVFADDEIIAIREGVKELGIGHWAAIKNRYPDILHTRTSVQIKDCYRTMLKKGLL